MGGTQIEEPRAYAASKRTTLLKRLNGDMGRALATWGRVLWPGVPVEALVGLSASSMGRTETGGEPDFATGLYGVEAAALPGLVGEASALLGRPVSDQITAEGYLDDPEGQVVTGLLNYRRHLAKLRAKTPAGLWTTETAGSSWELRCAVAAYSSGAARPAAVLTEWADGLVRVPCSERWPTAGQYVASAYERGDRRIGGERIRGKWRLAFMHLRAEQRIESGAALTSDPATLQWFARWSVEPSRQPLVRSLQRLSVGV